MDETPNNELNAGVAENPAESSENQALPSADVSPEKPEASKTENAENSVVETENQALPSVDVSPEKPEASKTEDAENPVVEKESPTPPGTDLNGNQKSDKPTVEVHPMVVNKRDKKRKFVDDSPPSSSKKGNVSSHQEVPPITDDSPLMLPFILGWTRELVYRAIQTSTKADAYYREPNGKKLRSMVEVERFIKGHELLSRENFSFGRYPLGLDDPAKETIRGAYFSGGRMSASPSPAKKTKKPPPRRKSSISQEKPPIDKLVISNIKQPGATCIKKLPVKTIRIDRTKKPTTATPKIVAVQKKPEEVPAAPKRPAVLAPKKPANLAPKKPAVSPKPVAKRTIQLSKNAGKLRLNLPALFSNPDKVQAQRIAVVTPKVIKPMPLSKKMEVLKAAGQSAKQPQPIAPKQGTTNVPKIQVKPIAQLVQQPVIPPMPKQNIRPNGGLVYVNSDYPKANGTWVGSNRYTGHLYPPGHLINSPSGPLKPIQNKSTISVRAPNFLLQPAFPTVDPSAQKRINWVPVPTPKLAKANSNNPEEIVCEPELPNFAMSPDHDERADRKFSDFLAGKIISPVSKGSLAIPGFPEFKRIKLVRRKPSEDVSLDEIAEVVSENEKQPKNCSPPGSSHAH